MVETKPSMEYCPLPFVANVANKLRDGSNCRPFRGERNVSFLFRPQKFRGEILSAFGWRWCGTSLLHYAVRKEDRADRREKARIMLRDFLLLPYPALPLSFSVCSATSVSAPTESMSEIYVRTAPQKLTRAFSHYKKAFK